MTKYAGRVAIKFVLTKINGTIKKLGTDIATFRLKFCRAKASSTKGNNEDRQIWSADPTEDISG